MKKNYISKNLKPANVTKWLVLCFVILMVCVSVKCVFKPNNYPVVVHDKGITVDIAQNMLQEPYNMQVVPKVLPYPFMDIEGRKKILPERNVCSIFPAETSLDAFYTGNGRTRITLLGNPYSESFSVSDQLLQMPWDGKANLPPDFSAIMPEIKRLLREGKFAEVPPLVDNAQRSQGIDYGLRKATNAESLGAGSRGEIMPGPQAGSTGAHAAYQLRFQQDFAGSPTNYLRYLDMMTGEFTVRWDTEQGAWSRKALVSYSDNLVLMEFNAPGQGLLNLDITVAPPASGAGGRNTTGPLRVLKYDVSNNIISMEIGYSPEFGDKGCVTVVKFSHQGGRITPTEQGVKVVGADHLLMLSKTERYETCFRNGISADAVKAVNSLTADYQRYVASNREQLGGRMGLSRIRLGKGDEWAMSSEELLRLQHITQGFNGALLEKLYDMGRFFQIVNTGVMPPRGGQHNINTNLQVCAGNMTGLDKEMDVYFRWWERKNIQDDFRVNAKRLFNARGFLAPVQINANSALFTHSSIDYPHHFWVGTLGWTYNDFWGHYLVTGDKEFLRNRIIPALKEIALFFEDYAHDTDEYGQSIFYPSFSPENPSGIFSPHGVYAISINAVMDIMICREVLDNLITGCTELGIEQDMIPHWKAQRAKLPKYLLDEEGGLKEWAWPTVRENYNHRHVSHHYDAWPGNVITWEDTPELAQSVLISNRKRAYQNDSAHGIIHRLFTAIRLKDEFGTINFLRHLMELGFVTRSMATVHNPYYLNQFADLQGAMPAVLAEMAVYSAPGVIELLPTMPQSLSQGSIFGVWLYTFAKLEQMNWNLEKKTIEAQITPIRDQELTFRYRPGGAEFYVDGSRVASDGKVIKIKAVKDKKINLSLRLSK